MLHFLHAYSHQHTSTYTSQCYLSFTLTHTNTQALTHQCYISFTLTHTNTQALTHQCYISSTLTHTNTQALKHHSVTFPSRLLTPTHKHLHITVLHFLHAYSHQHTSTYTSQCYISFMLTHTNPQALTHHSVTFPPRLLTPTHKHLHITVLHFLHAYSHQHTSTYTSQCYISFTYHTNTQALTHHSVTFPPRLLTPTHKHLHITVLHFFMLTHTNIQALTHHSVTFPSLTTPTHKHLHITVLHFLHTYSHQHTSTYTSQCYISSTLTHTNTQALTHHSVTFPSCLPTPTHKHLHITVLHFLHAYPHQHTSTYISQCYISFTLTHTNTLTHHSVTFPSCLPTPTHKHLHITQCYTNPQALTHHNVTFPPRLLTPTHKHLHITVLHFLHAYSHQPTSTYTSQCYISFMLTHTNTQALTHHSVTFPPRLLTPTHKHLHITVLHFLHAYSHQHTSTYTSVLHFLMLTTPTHKHLHITVLHFLHAYPHQHTYTSQCYISFMLTHSNTQALTHHSVTFPPRLLTPTHKHLHITVLHFLHAYPHQHTSTYTSPILRIGSNSSYKFL